MTGLLYEKGLSWTLIVCQALRENWRSFLFLTPWVGYFTVFLLAPSFLALRNSFLDINVLSPESTRFVGLGNWLSVLQDALFWQSVANVLFNRVIFIAISLNLSLMGALLLSEIRWLKGLFSTIFFLPVITSLTVAMIILDFVSGPAGPVQSLLVGSGWLESPVFWKFEKWLPMPVLAVFAAWKWCGLQTLIFLGGIAGINKSLYEVAELDGVSWWRRMTRITLPLIKPQIVFVLTVNIINGLQMFVMVFMNFDLNGGPYYSALTPGLYLYSTGFERMDMGKASVIGLLLALIIYLLTRIRWKVAG